jgi:hypothetical protein
LLWKSKKMVQLRCLAWNMFKCYFTKFVEIKPLESKLIPPQGIDSSIPSQVKCLFSFSFSVIFLLAYLSLSDRLNCLIRWLSELKLENNI